MVLGISVLKLFGDFVKNKDFSVIFRFVGFDFFGGGVCFEWAFLISFSSDFDGFGG